MTMRRFIFCHLFFMFFVPSAFSQLVHFNYDNAGNRTSKSVVSFGSRASGIIQMNTNEDNPQIGKDIFLSLTENNLYVKLQEFNNIKTGDLVISTEDGKILKNIHLTSDFTKISMTDCRNGVYLLGITLNNKRYSWKFSKK